MKSSATLQIYQTMIDKPDFQKKAARLVKNRLQYLIRRGTDVYGHPFTPPSEAYMRYKYANYPFASYTSLAGSVSFKYKSPYKRKKHFRKANPRYYDLTGDFYKSYIPNLNNYKIYYDIAQGTLNILYKFEEYIFYNNFGSSKIGLPKRQIMGDDKILKQQFVYRIMKKELSSKMYDYVKSSMKDKLAQIANTYNKD